MQEFSNVYRFESLHSAYKKARRGKRWKQAAAKFEINLLEALLLLRDLLKSKDYTLSPYNTFYVYEPKERLVMSNSYKDKVVQHALCDNILEPELTKSFIYDNAASQIGKGTDFARGRLKHFLQRFYRTNKVERTIINGNETRTELVSSADGYILKCDISKYFFNIEHEKIKEMIHDKISCEDTLWLIDKIIDSTEGKGIPIGNQSSQLFALEYLNGLDHYIKEKLKIEFYGRYMDDFYLIHKDKCYLEQCRQKISNYVSNLGLTLNRKTQITHIKNGINFIGFHFYLTDTGKVIMKLTNRSKHNMKRKLRRFKKLLNEGRITIEKIQESYQSWKAHAVKGDCYYLIKDMDELYNSLFNTEVENGKN